MTIWYKQGTCGDLRPHARYAKAKLAMALERRKEDLYITSLREGNHSHGSLHYEGNAFDIRKPQKMDLFDIRELLGDDYDIVDEATHIHIEYDPKED